MKMRVASMLVLPVALCLLAASPALAGKGQSHGHGNGGGHGNGHGHGNGGGHGKGGGGAKGTPAPIAGLGIAALAALGYGSRKLRKPPLQ